MELKDKLGPINWQFMATKKFDPDDFAALPRAPAEGGRGPARSATPSRCGTRASRCPSSWRSRASTASRSIADAAIRSTRQIADPTAPFVYARIMGTARTSRTAIPRPRSTPGRSGREPGPQAARPKGSTRSRRRRSGAPRRLPLRDQRRQGAQPGRGDGADRAAGVKRRQSYAGRRRVDGRCHADAACTVIDEGDRRSQPCRGCYPFPVRSRRLRDGPTRRQRRPAASRRPGAGLARPAHGAARRGDRRGDRARLWPRRVPAPAGASVLVPVVRRGDGDGLALVGDHHERARRAEARARAARGRARPLRLRRPRQPLAAARRTS